MKNLSEIILNPAIASKLQIIASLFKDKSIIIAYSGGIDSTLVCYLAKIYGYKMIAIHGSSALTPHQELIQAQKFAEKIAFPIEIISINPLSSLDIMQNSLNRCYFCKKLILARLEEYRKENQFDLVVDGTNYSDLSLTRAGLKALQESQVKSPLAIAQITKEEIIELTRMLELPSTDIPSQACLASRIPFGIQLNANLLKKIDVAEEILRTYLKPTTTLRVRVHPLNYQFHNQPQPQLQTQHNSQIQPQNGDKFLVWIESDNSFIDLIQNTEIRKNILEKLKKLGFVYITLDLDGFSSGSMHKLLN
jgi:uncharacterized protein